MQGRYGGGAPVERVADKTAAKRGLGSAGGDFPLLVLLLNKLPFSVIIDKHFKGYKEL